MRTVLCLVLVTISIVGITGLVFRENREKEFVRGTKG